MASTTFEKYGYAWEEGTELLKIEFAMCLHKEGLDRFPHYKMAMQLLWPEDDWHRWNELCLRKMLERRIVGIMGPASSGKTDIGAKFALLDYWLAPETTCHIVSSTDIRGLELRVWGRIKELFNRATNFHPWLAGHVLESMRTITTDAIDDEGDRARVLNKGIICIPCLQSGRYVGLGKYVGVKQKRLRLTSDECQLMGISFLDAVSNLKNNPDFHGNFMGNPIDPLDPLGMICEPVDGWTAHRETDKTDFWATKFLDGIAICLCGLDSPNNDYPLSTEPMYPYLISQKSIDEIAAFWGKDSQQYYSQAVGVMKSGLLSKRIINRDLCKEHHAQDGAHWRSPERVKVYACDAAYSGTGGDRCVGGWGEFGEDVDGKQILCIHPPKIIPVSVRSSEQPEYQIAHYIERDIIHLSIPSTQVFYDSTGRGTLGAAFASVFKDKSPVPVEFGGKPSRRPVRHDLFVVDPTVHGGRRLKRCDEHYLDFVSELWFSVRYIIECNQMRELPTDVMSEGCQREYGTSAGNKFFVESKHDPKARERMRLSPDLFDWLATLCEGARQLGFKIERIGAIRVEGDESRWLLDRANSYRKWLSGKQLTHR